jgi:Predicted transcriptional regulators
MNPNYIKKLREKNQLTQEYLAAQIGVSRPTYAQIEQGQRGLTVTEAKKWRIFSVWRWMIFWRKKFNGQYQTG